MTRDSARVGFLVGVVLVGVVACGGGRGRGGGPGVDGGASDGAVRFDAGPLPDGAMRDAGHLDDGGVPLDSAVPVDAARDGGPADAGAVAPLCRAGCSGVADCDSGSLAFDADNYDCTAGVCVYRGCNTDGECVATFASSAYGCFSLSGLRTCLHRCAVAADCDTGSPAFDADNYSCTAGHCEYDGCRNDAECTGTFGGGYVCAMVTPPDTGVPIPTAARNCVLGCATRADCTTGSPAFDADNYDCVAGACHYEGCNTDTECQSTFGATAYVCR